MDKIKVLEGLLETANNYHFYLNDEDREVWTQRRQALTSTISDLRAYEELKKRIDVESLSVKLVEASSFVFTPPNYEPIKLCFLPTPEIRSVVAQKIVNYLGGKE